MRLTQQRDAQARAALTALRHLETERNRLTAQMIGLTTRPAHIAPEVLAAIRAGSTRPGHTLAGHQGHEPGQQR